MAEILAKMMVLPFLSIDFLERHTQEIPKSSK
jgi:hypothetical protein